HVLERLHAAEAHRDAAHGERRGEGAGFAGGGGHARRTARPSKPCGRSSSTSTRMRNPTPCSQPVETRPPATFSTIPRTKPPTSAPGRLSSPPSTAATKPASPSVRPMSYVAPVIGAITTPPNPPIAAAATKLQNANVRRGIPNVDAIGGFATAARTAVPAYVCRKKRYSAPKTITSVSSTHSACGGSAPPKIVIAAPPVNGFKLSGFV